jgi:hypothetical protein
LELSLELYGPLRKTNSHLKRIASSKTYGRVGENEKKSNSELSTCTYFNFDPIGVAAAVIVEN